QQYLLLSVIERTHKDFSSNALTSITIRHIHQGSSASSVAVSPYNRSHLFLVHRRFSARTVRSSTIRALLEPKISSWSSPQIIPPKKRPNNKTQMEKV